eukprot:jgi/Undpi1/4544/HiC_scaffold_18.g07898.m1
MTLRVTADTIIQAMLTAGAIATPAAISTTAASALGTAPAPATIGPIIAHGMMTEDATVTGMITTARGPRATDLRATRQRETVVRGA